MHYEFGERHVWVAQFDGIYDIFGTKTTLILDDLTNASLLAIDENDNIWASGYNNTGYLDTDGVWHRIPELENMQANKHAFYYIDEKIAFNSIHITQEEGNDVITYDGLWEYTRGTNSHVEEEPSPYALQSIAYPNPFNTTTSISFELPVSEHVTIDIYTITGQRINRLTDKRFHPGTNIVHWNGLSDTGEAVASGLYFYRISTKTTAATGKLLLLK